MYEDGRCGIHEADVNYMERDVWNIYRDVWKELRAAEEECM